jgi:hypothetical protein
MQREQGGGRMAVLHTLTNLTIPIPIFDERLEVRTLRPSTEQRTVYSAWDIKILVDTPIVELDFQNLARTIVPN